MTLIIVVLFVTVYVLFLKVAYAWGLMDGARRMAETQERDASLKSAARRLDAEWDREHGQPT